MSAFDFGLNEHVALDKFAERVGESSHRRARCVHQVPEMLPESSPEVCRLSDSPAVWLLPPVRKSPRQRAKEKWYGREDGQFQRSNVKSIEHLALRNNNNIIIILTIIIIIIIIKR